MHGLQQQQYCDDDISLKIPLIIADQNPQAAGGGLQQTSGNSSGNGGGAATFLKTCFNGLNALAGVGILSVPYALASGGWLSLALLFAIAAVAFYSGLLMQRCMDKNSNIKTYPDIGELAFGKIGRLVVSTSMYTELYLVSIGFLILEGDNLSNLFPIMEIQVAGLAIGGKQFFVVVAALVILPTMWLDNLSLLSYVSASGVFASAIIIFSISWTATFDGVGFHEKGTLISWNGIPTAVSLYAFCYCAHPVFPTLYNSMRKKHQFSNVLLVCFLFTTAGYASMGIIGYLMFGSKVESQDLLPRKYKNRVTNISISTMLVISTVIIALAVPFFGYLMSLVGAILSVTASILLPCLCYLKISGKYKNFGCEMFTIVAIILAAIAMGISGTYTSLLEIIHHL